VPLTEFTVIASRVMVTKVLLVTDNLAEYAQRCPGNRRLRSGLPWGLSGGAFPAGRREPMMVDVDLSVLAWRKSSACFESGCVEVAAFGGRVLVRGTGDMRNATLTFSCRDWDVFLRRLRHNVPCKDMQLNDSSLLPRGALC
jgi:hypothetical protein